MKIIGFLLLISSLYNSQIIKDSILGKPKYVKEYVVFLNNSGPFTFMQGDSEYGHAVIMIPKFLRERMSKTWFESNFCRYINNETHYNSDRKITKEIWYYKSGKVVDDYSYEYDKFGRLKKEYSKNSYSDDIREYFYEGNNKYARFEKSTYRRKSEKTEFYLKDNNQFNQLSVSKYDSISKTDSIFSVTNKYMKHLGERTFTSAQDSIYRPRLTKIRIFNDSFRVIKEKLFNPDDYNLNKIFFSNEINYQYDSVGRISKTTQFHDDKYHYFILEKNGKYREEIKNGNIASNSTTEYEYDSNSIIKTITNIYQGKISHQIRFEYKNNLIEKLYYLDTWGKKENELKHDIIIFKYKFDKHKNWTECTKNVNGKDLYIWKREIQYYK